ncbi:alpha/beta fold hydrolase [Sphingomonas corticis]|jgi:polyhydroxyalkanoate synthase|nr:alpha/beta fold hydrolase [Sphingomonas corticis]
MLRSETAASSERRAAALAGLRRYQQAPRPRRVLPPARFRKGAARLRDVGGDVTGPPVVFVPSLINPPFVLDLAPGRSLVRHVAARGFRAWLVDWGTPRPQDAGLDLAGHVADRLLPLLAKLDRPPILVGYCLGGTLALAAAALPGARCAGVATIAAPWHFAGYGEAARAEMTALWQRAEPAARAIGALPMEVLQAGFWRLDPARTIAKYEAFATMPDAQAATFVALEDWANAGAPLTYAAGADLFDALLSRDLPGRGEWQVGGHAVDPARLACPVAQFVSRTDRITPAATAADVGERHDLSLGHVGMVVGGRAQAMLYDPLTEWLVRLAGARGAKHLGSTT